MPLPASKRRVPGKPGIHDDAHAFYRQAGFRYGGRQDDFPQRGRQGGDGRVLLGQGKIAVKGTKPHGIAAGSP